MSVYYFLIGWCYVLSGGGIACTLFSAGVCLCNGGKAHE